MRRVLLTAGLALTLVACAALPTLIAAPTPTAEARPSRTHRPTRTPQSTETLAATPELPASHTPTVQAPLPASTPAATVPPVSPSTSPLPPSALDCKLMWQSPPNGAAFPAGERFSAGWKLKNIGTSAWEPGSFRFVYLGGARLYTGDEVPLPQSVAPGGSVVLSVPIRTPWNLGVYTTHWGIRQGEAFFCRLTLTIQVEP